MIATVSSGLLLVFPCSITFLTMLLFSQSLSAEVVAHVRSRHS